MSLSVGIIGLPNVGKSTTFNALLKKKQAEASNFPFCTIEPNVGCVTVPDERLDKIFSVSQSRKKIPTTIEFVDIAGLVKGAHKGEGLGNQFLSHIREVDAIVEVVRNFQNPDVAHVAGKVQPEDDMETINLELIMADLQTVNKRLEKVSKDAKSGDKVIMQEKTVLEKIKIELSSRGGPALGGENEKPVRDMQFTEEKMAVVKSYNLLTAKPLLYVFNVDEKNDFEAPTEGAGHTNVITLNAQLESEIAELPEDEQEEYKKELGIAQTGLDKLITASYRLLNLITFFTFNEKETRAWTVKKGTKAPEAAGIIHTDFQKNFIRAEVINWEKFVEAGGWTSAKEKGIVRTEGKDCEIKDGDICYFLINK